MGLRVGAGAALTSNKSAAQALRDRLKTLVSNKRSAEDAAQDTDGYAASEAAAAKEDTNEHNSSQAVPQKRLKPEDAAEAAVSMDGIDGSAAVKQERGDLAMPGSNGSAIKAEDGGSAPDAASFWAKLADDDGTKPAEEKPHANGHAAAHAEERPPKPEGSEVANPTEKPDAAVKVDGGPAAEDSVMENGDDAAAEEADEVISSVLSCARIRLRFYRPSCLPPSETHAGAGWCVSDAARVLQQLLCYRMSWAMAHCELEVMLQDPDGVEAALLEKEQEVEAVEELLSEEQVLFWEGHVSLLLGNVSVEHLHLPGHSSACVPLYLLIGLSQ